MHPIPRAVEHSSMQMNSGEVSDLIFSVDF